MICNKSHRFSNDGSRVLKNKRQEYLSWSRYEYIFNFKYDGQQVQFIIY